MRVLLVEDEANLADSVTRGLQAEGFAVDWEADGADGLWRATEGTYDAIILDIMLPSMNGYSICRELRAADIWTPVLMLTAKEGEYDEAEAFEFGADDYLRKPFSHIVLVARLRSLIRRAATDRGASDGVELGELVLSHRTQTASWGDRQVELTAREFALLDALVRRSPSIISKPELLDAVWGMDFEGDANIVEVYVGYVRKKLATIAADGAGDRIIRTVRGAGYQVQVPDAQSVDTQRVRDAAPVGGRGQ